MKTTRTETQTVRVEITLDDGNAPDIAYTDLRPVGYLLETHTEPPRLASMPQVLAAIEDAIDGTAPVRDRRAHTPLGNDDNAEAAQEADDRRESLEDTMLNARDALDTLLAHPEINRWLEEHLDWTRREVADQRESLRSARDDLDSIVRADK